MIAGRAQLSVVISVSRFHFIPLLQSVISHSISGMLFAISRSLTTYGIIIRVPLDNLYNFRNSAISSYPNAVATLAPNALKFSCPYHLRFNAIDTSIGVFLLKKGCRFGLMLGTLLLFDV
ncbi:MAG TPA: hypothetical protein VHF08_04910 [Nitrososphaeraceae archaeon]|nr:hypothetical protein [Nitrososphaeraceae archaeon]